MLLRINPVIIVLLTAFSIKASGQPGMNLSIGKKDNKPYKNRALIVGTDTYNDKSLGNLNNPVFDAKSVKLTLEEKYGFVSTSVINGTGAEILRALRNLKDEVEQENSSCNTNLFVFIAGHGKHSASMGGYLVPSDASAGSSERSDGNIYFSDLDTMIDNIPAKHILVVLDVCYGGTFNEVYKRKRGTANEMYASKTEAQIITRRNAFASRKYLTSGGKEQVNDGVPDRHSPFVDRLIKLLDEHYSSGRALLFTELCADMSKMTDPTPVFDNFGLEPDPAGDFILQPLLGGHGVQVNGTAGKDNSEPAGIAAPKVIVIPRETADKDILTMLNDQDVRLGLSKVQECLESGGVKTVPIPQLKPTDKPNARKKILSSSGATIYVEVDFARNVQEDTYSLTVTLNAIDIASNNVVYYKTCPSGYFRTTDYGILTGRVMKTVGGELTKKITDGSR